MTQPTVSKHWRKICRGTFEVRTFEFELRHTPNWEKLYGRAAVWCGCCGRQARVYKMLHGIKQTPYIHVSRSIHRYSCDQLVLTPARLSADKTFTVPGLTCASYWFNKHSGHVASSLCTDSLLAYAEWRIKTRPWWDGAWSMEHTEVHGWR